MHVVQGNHVGVVINLLGECISEPGKAPDTHSQAKVLALYEAGRDVLRVGTAHDRLTFAARAYGGTIARFLLAGLIGFACRPYLTNVSGNGLAVENFPGFLMFQV